MGGRSWSSATTAPITPPRARASPRLKQIASTAERTDAPITSTCVGSKSSEKMVCPNTKSTRRVNPKRWLDIALMGWKKSFAGNWRGGKKSTEHDRFHFDGGISLGCRLYDAITAN